MVLFAETVDPLHDLGQALLSVPVPVPRTSLHHLHNALVVREDGDSCTFLSSCYSGTDAKFDSDKLGP